MGSSQSSKKKENLEDVIQSEDNENSVASNPSLNNEIIANKSMGNNSIHRSDVKNYSFSSISKSNSCKSKNPVDGLDFSIFENEDPIQRRRRIMSGDRRDCYILKLGSLRQAQEKKLSEERKLNKLLSLKNLIHPEKQKNKLIETETQRNTSKVTNCGEQNSNDCTNLKIHPVESNKKRDEGTDNKNDLKIISEFSPARNKEELKNSVKEKQISTMICNNINEGHKNIQPKCPLLISLNKDVEPSLTSLDNLKEINRENLGLSKSKLCYQVFVDYPTNQEKKFDPLSSSTELIENNRKEIPNTSNSTALSENINENENKKQKSLCKVFPHQYGITEKCFNPGRSDNNIHKIVLNGPSEIIPGYDSMITFESDYSVNGFESDLKSVYSSESIKNFKNKITSLTSIGTCPSSSFTTMISYNKVKKLFKKRIAEIEIEESMSSTSSLKNCHYKKLNFRWGKDCDLDIQDL